MNKQKQLVIFNHCIACSTCNNVAPTVFGLNSDGSSATVINQPNCSLIKKKSLEAMKSCPVSAIGVQ
ncbi:4Fe-4S ferredoxin [Candidatus Marinamargulisbacteria bacterium SCGC AG-343-K17]|nr:4Fe-4S ferredoxin [Candidatus Marinamargulisbacteria bacterium SCGC AG-343-K17]